MKSKISKTNERTAYFNALLDEVRMSGHERLKAKARMAQAEAFADALGALFGLVKRVLKAPTPRHYRRPTTSAG
jgi:hypothetical protein